MITRTGASNWRKPRSIQSWRLCPAHIGARQPVGLDSAGRLRASIGVRPSGTNADNRLPLASFGRVQGGDGVVEGRDGADVRPQSAVPHPLDDLTELGTIGLDNEVDRQAAGGAAPRAPRRR